MEREYNVPLRREWLKVPKYKRAKKAVTAMKQFLSKHMKSEEVKLGPDVNEKLWSQGMRNPPHHVKVLAKKDAEGVVTAELATEKKAPAKAKKAPAKAEKAPAKEAKPAEEKETPKAEKAPAKEAKAEPKKAAEEKSEAK